MIFNKDYFDRVFAREGGWGYAVSEYERVKYSRQLQVIQRYFPRPGRILEVGCAEGLFSAMLAEAFRRAEIWCVDISPVAVDRARQHCGCYQSFKLIEGDIIELLQRQALPRSVFDVIVQSESLYYLFPKLALQGLLVDYLKNVAGALNNGGIFVTANGISLVTKGVLAVYYRVLGRLCDTVYGVRYKEWNEFRRKRFTYELKVFRKVH